MRHYFHIKEELTMDELSAGAEPQTVHLEVANKGAAVVLLAQYEPAFIAGGKPYEKKFRTNRHKEKLPCLSEDL